MTKTIKRTLPPLPEIDDVTRRAFLIGLGSLLVFAPYGCGGNAEEESSGEVRTVEHWAGTTEVPAEPARVVALDPTVATNLIHLGLTPAGAGEDLDAWLDPYAELLPDYLDVGDIEQVGDDYEPNLEAIAALEPDLIVGTEFHEEIYDQLSEIAPTVLVEYVSNGAWRQRFQAVAEAVGRSERAEEVEAHYERVIAELPEEVREATVAFIRPDNGQFRIDSIAGAFPGSVAEDAGIPTLDAPEGVGEIDEGSGFVTVSGERLGIVEDAGLIVVPDFRAIGEDADSITQFERNSLWETLPAVREGRVLQVPGALYNGGNYYAAEVLLREVGQTLT